MAKQLLGKEVTAAMNEKIKANVAVLKEKGISPKLGIIRVGEREDDISYERGATKRCETLGVEFEKFLLPQDVTEEELLAVIDQVNKDDSIHGVLLFRPLPKHLNEEKIINALLDQSNLMVSYMDDVKVKISEQREKLDMTIDKFSAVANGVDNSLVNIGNITNGMNELRKSRDVILDVISDLSAVSQQYAASTNGTIEAAQTMNDAMKAVENASQKLKHMSDDLTNELEIFKLS